jgi:hypothetical protein
MEQRPQVQALASHLQTPLYGLVASLALGYVSVT